MQINEALIRDVVSQVLAEMGQPPQVACAGFDGRHGIFEDANEAVTAAREAFERLSERTVEDFDFGKDPNYPNPESFDLTDHGLLGYRDPENMLGYFVAACLLDAATGTVALASGPLAFAMRLAKLGITIAKMATGSPVLPGMHFIQYEISPNRHLQTPSGDTLPDILGPGKGDVLSLIHI